MGNYSTPTNNRVLSQCKTPRKRAASFSITHEKKVKTDERQNGQHNDMNVIDVTLQRGHPSKSEKYEGTWTFYHQFSGNFKQEYTGFQCVFDGEAICSRSQLVGAPLGATVLGTNIEWSQNPFDLNPYQYTTGGVIIPKLETAPAPDFVHLAGGHMELNVLSMETVDMEVDIEWFMCKKNTDNSPIQSWQYALLNKALGQGGDNNPLNGGVISRGYPNISVGGKEYGSTVVAANTDSTYGIYPSSEKEFRGFWKSMKKVKFILQPGTTKRINVKIDYHKTFSRATLQTMPQKYLAGYTIVPIYIVRSAPVYDNISTTVTPGPIRIGYASQTKYRFMAPASKVSRLEYNRSDPQFYYQPTLANMKVVNAVDETVSVKIE